jgi:hypothetical protein
MKHLADWSSPAPPPQVDNKSKVDIKSVQVLLEQRASIKDHVQMTRTVASHCFEGLVSGTSRTGGAALQAMLPVDHQLRATSLGQVCLSLWAQPLHAACNTPACTHSPCTVLAAALADGRMRCSALVLRCHVTLPAFADRVHVVPGARAGRRGWLLQQQRRHQGPGGP